jgi:hypothetical protein
MARSVEGLSNVTRESSGKYRSASRGSLPFQIAWPSQVITLPSTLMSSESCIGMWSCSRKRSSRRSPSNLLLM